MSKSHDNAQELQDLIQNDKATYKQVYELLKKDPTLLAWSSATISIPMPPLNTAVSKNNLQAAEAILDIMSEHKELILKEINYTVDHPFYIESGLASTTTLIKSPEMVNLLHSKGFDLSRGRFEELYAGQLCGLLNNRSFFGMPSASEIAQKKKIFRAALDHKIFGYKAFAETAYWKLSSLVDEDEFARTERYKKLASNIMEMVARLGADCRYTLDHDPDDTDPSGQVRQAMQSSLRAFADKAAVNYLTEKNPEEKQELLRAVCACRKLPELLSACVKSDTQSATAHTPALISSLDPEWKEVYHNEIRLAETKIARTVTAKPTVFADYVRSGAPSGAGKGPSC